MASSTAHGVLVAGEVTTVVVQPGFGGVVIVNRSMAGAIWVRIDGDDPVGGGADSYVVLGVREFELPRSKVQHGPLAVKMISDEARAYTVEAIA